MRIIPLDSWIKEKTNGIDLRAWQLSKLNETLELARSKSAFYKKHFEGLPETLSALDDLRQFPFTAAEDIRQNPLRFVCVSQSEIQRIVTLQTSGTTGEPKRIFFTAEDQELTIDFFGVGMSTLTEPDERVLIFLPGETPGSVGDLLRMGLERKGRKPIPYGMVKDPFHALSIARRWSPKNKAPRTVLLSTDYVPAAIVDVLESIWGCKVFNHYGTTEMGLGGGVECEAHRGYHLREADMLFEIVNPETGEPVSDGEYGEVVFTTLTRRGMPLIRYRMGDRSRFIVGKCPCGTKLRTMEKIRGRFSGFVSMGEETLKLPDFDEALFKIQELLNFSVTVSSSGGDESLLVEAHTLTDEDSTREVEQAVESLSSKRKIVKCYHSPNEVGSLLKRVNLDKRGNNGKSI